jgi:hypothetical protein
VDAFGDKERRARVAIPDVVKGDRRVKKACAAYERVVAELASAKEALGQLFVEREQAEHARLEQDAEALVRGATVDAHEARDFELEIANASRRVQTCERALELAQVELTETFDRHREALQASAAERIESARAGYRAALEELERARRTFWTERRIEGWVREFPHARKGTLPDGDVRVRGLVNEQTGEPYEWTRLREALLGEFDPPEAAEPARPATKLINAPAMRRP